MLAFVAVFLFDKTKEFRFVYHALLMVPFVHFGYWFKKKFFSNWITIISATALYVLGAILYYVYDKQIPYFELGFGIDVFSFLPFVCLAISGTIMMIGMSKLMDCKLFQAIGRQSLVIFMVHSYILKILIRLCSSLINNSDSNPYISALIFIATLVVTIAMCMVAAKMLNTKYMKWILGK